ncbi:MAG TPA: hypothetical protein LFV66_02210 [Rickettsia endosymbiont of Bembidion lapponicum]|nr:hypothetical protein [Rickettsia endosymbiont of Bembidion lapponicum]
MQQRLVDSISNEWKKYSLVTTSIGNTDFYPKLNVKSVSFNTASNGLASEVLGDSNSDHNVELS